MLRSRTGVAGVTACAGAGPLICVSSSMALVSASSVSNSCSSSPADASVAFGFSFITFSSSRSTPLLWFWFAQHQGLDGFTGRNIFEQDRVHLFHDRHL